MGAPEFLSPKDPRARYRPADIASAPAPFIRPPRASLMLCQWPPIVRASRPIKAAAKTSSTTLAAARGAIGPKRLTKSRPTIVG